MPLRLPQAPRIAPRVAFRVGRDGLARAGGYGPECPAAFCGSRKSCGIHYVWHDGPRACLVCRESKEHHETLYRWLPLRSGSLSHHIGARPIANLLVQRLPANLFQWHCQRDLSHRVDRDHRRDKSARQSGGQWQPGHPSLLPGMRHTAILRFKRSPWIHRRALGHTRRSVIHQANGKYLERQRPELGLHGSVA